MIIPRMSLYCEGKRTEAARGAASAARCRAASANNNEDNNTNTNTNTNTTNTNASTNNHSNIFCHATKEPAAEQKIRLLDLPLPKLLQFFSPAGLGGGTILFAYNMFKLEKDNNNIHIHI